MRSRIPEPPSAVRHAAGRGALVLVLAISGAAPVPAEVGEGTSASEVRCQARVAQALSTQAATHASCVRRCARVPASYGRPADPCLPPDYDEETAACILDGEEVSRETIRRACPDDGSRDACPEAYEERWGSCAEMAVGRVAVDHGQFGVFTQLVLCEGADRLRDPSGTAKARCQASLARALVGHFRSVNDVYARCNVALAAGIISTGSCVPGSTAHPRLSPGNVVPRISARVAASIDRACFRPPAVAPACYGAAGGSPGSGEAWVALVNAIAESAADSNTFPAEPNLD